MNNIIKPLTVDGNLGFDEFGQLFAFTQEEGDWGCVTGRIVRDLRGQRCGICGQTFTLSAESYINARYNDEAGRFVHNFCWQQFESLEERFMWRGMLYELRIPFEMTELPNGYTGGKYGPAWLQIQLYRKYPKIIVGRRKRVWSMALLNADITPEEYAASLLSKIEDTKSYSSNEVMVHAWQRNQCKDYLKAMWDLCQRPNQCRET